MMVRLKGVAEPVEVDDTVPIGIASYPDKNDDSVSEHHIHFFVKYNSAWAEISLRSYNQLQAAGNPVQNI